MTRNGPRNTGRPATARYRMHLAVVGVAGGLVLAGCAKGTTAGPASPAVPSPGPAFTIAAAAVPGVGSVLVNGAGQVLYALTAEQGGTLTCAGPPCTQAWPDVVLPAGRSSAVAGAGVQAPLLGAATAPGGTHVVTYSGWPLHTFTGDAGSGLARGEGIVSFGGTWEVLTPAGATVPPAPPSPSPSPSPARPAVTPRAQVAPTAPVAPAPSPQAPVAPVAPPSPSPAAPASPSPVPTYGYGY